MTVGAGRRSERRPDRRQCAPLVTAVVVVSVRTVRFQVPFDRARTAWWTFVPALAAVAGFIACSFVGPFSPNAFGYYATRPIYRKVRSVVGRDGVAAWLTILLVPGPILLLLAYAGVRAFHQVRAWFGSSSRHSSTANRSGRDWRRESPSAPTRQARDEAADGDGSGPARGDPSVPTA